MERLTTLKEGAAWAKNQAVLNEISEENGQLTYKGKTIILERPTDTKTIYGADGNLDYDGDGTNKTLILKFYDLPEGINFGTEIKDVEIRIPTISDNFIKIEDLITVDGNPCVPMLKKVSYVEAYAAIYFFGIYCPLYYHLYASTIASGAPFDIRVTYYTD